MQNAIVEVQHGKAVERLEWAMDGHFSAMSLQYNTAVFIYSIQMQRWYIFNELRSCGYICLSS